MVKHLALIMDGNRRWARKRALQPWFGHEEGIKPVRIAINFCLEHSIDTLTLYTFSLENFKRSALELEYLFQLILAQIKNQADELMEQQVQIKFIGDNTAFPQKLIKPIADIESRTKENKKLLVNMLFCYGGQQELLDVAQRIAHDISNKKISSTELNNKKIFEQYLWLNKQPDLVIRTGGARRMSNFLPYQSAYSELYFIDTLWPDITKEHFQQAFQDFTERKRNFGG